MTESIDRITVPSIINRKVKGRIQERIAALTAYDFLTAKLLDSTGIDILLVGDSLGCIVQGHKNTLPVTLDDMVYHSRCVSRGVKRALVVGDMPFMSYQSSIERSIDSAGRFLKEGGVSAVKLEGGVNVAETIRKIVSIDIPVMAHIGLTPQSFHRMGGHKVQGKKHATSSLEAGTWERIIEDARAVEGAGAFSVVIEGVPPELAKEITSKLHIPTIGIGAGDGCDGQIYVTHDILGLDPEFKPKFVKRYAELGILAKDAIGRFVSEVKENSNNTQLSRPMALVK